MFNSGLSVFIKELLLLLLLVVTLTRILYRSTDAEVFSVSK